MSLASKVAWTNDVSGRLDGKAAFAGFAVRFASGLPAAAIPSAMATAAEALADELFLRLMRWTGLMEPTERECEWARGWGERVWELTAAPAGERVGGEARLAFSYGQKCWWTTTTGGRRCRGMLTLELVILAAVQLRNRASGCRGRERCAVEMGRAVEAG
jgi:hypothetical protein